MSNIIDGKLVSEHIKTYVKGEIDKLTKSGSRPTLAVIIVGNDQASKIYVNNKKKACEFTGIKSVEYALDESVSEYELLELIHKLNNDDGIDGILCQLPLPNHINEDIVINSISPKKDVDCFNQANVGKVWQGKYELAPCTPMGIIELLDYYKIPIEGKNCVIVGRSNIVGKPMAALLLERNATVTVCHSKTQDLCSFTRNADVIVAAVGRANFITADMVKEGAVVIDVGINRVDGKIYGDVDFDNVKVKASFITPVPGGCGLTTTATLMKNTLLAYKNKL